MSALLLSLYLLPVLVSGLLLLLPTFLSRVVVIIASLVLSVLSVIVFVNTDAPVYFSAPHDVGAAVAIADIVLLFYFGWMAWRRRSVLVGLMTVLQAGGLLYLLQTLPAGHAPQFMVDKMGAFMFLLINVISGIIAIYALRYMEEEPCGRFRRKFFLSTIFWFIAVMNAVVSSDNLEYFFLFFELTTLASFLFIGFRRDKESEKNAVTALWMNQAGGLAILAAIFFMLQNGYSEITFSNLLAHAGTPQILLPLSLLSVAALIKGAQLPFSKWLLGAMVAPTPVSALLHSSTMVKIAPFIILRLSPALKDTAVSTVLIALCGFVFVAAAIGALAQDNFKRILAHSTIALLALMIMMAAAGTPVTLAAALILILFHGFSKSLLFLDAGVLEKVFHVKQTSDMDRLGEKGPYTAFIITIGFVSLLLPPFGAFIGKWFSIETMGALATGQKLLGALVIVAIAGGGAVLSLLYFKVMGLLLARSGQRDRIPAEHIHPVYRYTLNVLLVLIMGAVLCFPVLLPGYFVPVASHIAGMPLEVTMQGWNMHIGTMTLPVLPLLVAFLLLPGTLIAALFVRFTHVDRAKEYMCGEKLEYSFSSFYFSTDRATPWFAAIGGLFFILLILVAVVPGML